MRNFSFRRSVCIFYTDVLIKSKKFRLTKYTEWFITQGFPQGAFWASMTALVSVLNDVITRFIGTRLCGIEIGFFRYFFSMLTLLPFMLHGGVSTFKTKNPKMHFWRAAIGVIAIGLHIYAVIHMTLTEVISLSFTQPLLFLPLAVLFLGEKTALNRWVATSIGFMGMIVLLNPGSSSFQYMALIPVSSAFCFALLDVIAKKMVVVQERTTTMLFYFSLGTTVVGFMPTIFVWKTPTLNELLWLFLLGAGANLIQVCLFQAFKLTEATPLAPFRYLELIYASIFGYIFFQQVPMLTTYVGATIILAGTVYLTYSERQKEL